jgi:hypothetical protein
MVMGERENVFLCLNICIVEGWPAVGGVYITLAPFGTFCEVSPKYVVPIDIRFIVGMGS